MRKYKNSVFRNIYEQPYNELARLKLYNSTKAYLSCACRKSGFDPATKLAALTARPQWLCQLYLLERFWRASALRL